MKIFDGMKVLINLEFSKIPLMTLPFGEYIMRS